MKNSFKKAAAVLAAIMLTVSPISVEAAAPKTENGIIYIQNDGSEAIGDLGQESEFDKNDRLISDWKVFVNGNELELDKSEALYMDGEILMIPVCKISKALGYTVSFDEKSETAAIDDNYIQKAVLTIGSDIAVFKGHLKIIKMDREVTLSAPIKKCGDCLYVSSEFFGEFFNDVDISDNIVSIAPSKSQLL